MTYITHPDKCLEIAVTDIQHDTVGTCTFEAGSSCTAQHVFSVGTISLETPVTYLWSTDTGIILGDNTGTSIVVDITSNRDRVFTISCEISNGYVTGEVTQQFTSTHTVIQTCIHANTDGTWYGYEYDNFGKIDNEFLADDTTRQYARKWKEDGEWRAMFGSDGLLQLTDVDKITVEYLGISRQATWDGAGYVIYDTTMTADSQLSYDECARDFCIAMHYLPHLVIEVDFKEITDG